MTYLYLEQVTSALTNNALYMEHTTWKKWVMYELQSAKLPGVFESLSDFVAAALITTKPEPRNRAAVELEKRTGRGKEAKSRKADLFAYEEKRSGFCGKHITFL